MSLPMSSIEIFVLMSPEELKAFTKKGKEDNNIKDKLKAAKSSEEVVETAKQHGHEFSTEHINKPRKSELERLAGGGGCAERTACWNVENSFNQSRTKEFYKQKTRTKRELGRITKRKLNK